MWPVGTSNDKHEYSDKGNNIIHTYMRLLQTRLLQSDGDLYKERTNDRPVLYGQKSISEKHTLPVVLSRGQFIGGGRCEKIGHYPVAWEYRV